MYLYVYKRDGNFHEIEIMDIVTDKPNWFAVASLVNNIWDWDLSVEYVEISELTAKECGLPTLKMGEKETFWIMWNKCCLPISTPVSVVVSNLPEGIFAIAYSSYPKEFPATCYLTDEKRHNDRYKNSVNK